MPKPMTHAERNAETRRRLLASARRIFLRKGFHAASLADVAKDAGYTKGAVFSQFENKSALFLALLEQRSSERLAELATLRLEPQSATSLVKAFTSYLHEHVIGDRAWSLLVIEFRVYAARNPSANRGYAAIHARTCARMAEIYKAILSDAGLEAVLDLDTLARAALGVSAGLLLEQSAEPALDVATITEAIGRGMFGAQRSIRR